MKGLAIYSLIVMFFLYLNILRGTTSTNFGISLAVMLFWAPMVLVNILYLTKKK